MIGFRNAALFCLIALLHASGCAPKPSGVYHVVAEGQTLYRISKTYGVDEKTLIQANRIGDPGQLKIGTRLFIPNASKPLPVPPATARAQVREPSKKAVQAASAPQPATATKSPKPATKPSTAPLPDKSRFNWPVRGKVVKTFGKTGATNSQGLEIAVPLQTPVKSAAAGKVIYCGDGIVGYGHLVILEHEESFFTVYGFNAKLLVKSGSFVGKGEKIALSGSPPGGGTPRIHFEIRRGKEPVDPFFYLP